MYFPFEEEKWNFVLPAMSLATIILLISEILKLWVGGYSKFFFVNPSLHEVLK